MSSKLSRATRMRDYMAKDPSRTYMLREIAAAVEPGVDLNLISGSMASLVSQGDVVRIGRGPRHVSYRLSVSNITGKPERIQAPPPPAEAARQSISGIAPTKGAGPRRSQPTNFMAAPGTVTNTYCPHRAASQRISADIASFEQRGGRIEVLGITQLFHHTAGKAKNED